MNLRFTPTALALALSVSAVLARSNSEDVVLGGSELAERSPHRQDAENEKITAHNRRVAELISTLNFEQGGASGRKFHYPDVGILQGRKGPRPFAGPAMHGKAKLGGRAADSANNVPRLLQAEEAPMCGTNGTCPPKACECLANGVGISDECAPVFNSQCNGYTDADGKEWKAEGCMRDLPELYKTFYCQIAKCVAGGESSASCYCEVYQSLCLTYGDEPLYNVSMKVKTSFYVTTTRANTLRIYFWRRTTSPAFVPFTNAAEIRLTKKVRCHAWCICILFETSIARSIRCVEQTALASPVSATALPICLGRLSALLQLMPSVME